VLRHHPSASYFFLLALYRSSLCSVCGVRSSLWCTLPCLTGFLPAVF
jgi:hypothetical protein